MLTKKQIVTGLAVLNAGLLSAFVWRALPANVAQAQPSGMRQKSDNVVATAETPGGTLSVVIVVDQANRQMTALASARGVISAQPVIQLDPIFEGSNRPVRPR